MARSDEELDRTDAERLAQLAHAECKSYVRLALIDVLNALRLIGDGAHDTDACEASLTVASKNLERALGKQTKGNGR